MDIVPSRFLEVHMTGNITWWGSLVTAAIVVAPMDLPAAGGAKIKVAEQTFEFGAVLEDEPAVKTDYFAVVNGTTLMREKTATAESAAIVAARLGSTRLIDNMIMGGDDEN